MKTFIFKAHKITVVGNAKLYVQGDHYTEVDGNQYVTVRGDRVTKIQGNDLKEVMSDEGDKYEHIGADTYNFTVGGKVDHTNTVAPARTGAVDTTDSTVDDL
jgi:hypothetical protein